MKRVAILAVLIALTAAACSGGHDMSAMDEEPTGEASATDRTVEVEMTDIAFTPDSIEVERGETVRFVFRNGGAVNHDAFIGDQAAQDDHEAEMEEMEGMDGMDHGDDDEAITVEPDDEGALRYTFDQPGRLLIGCHQPGHFDAGMVIEIDVT